MKKTICILIAIIMIAFVIPSVIGDTTNITGTFNPTSTMSASLDNSTWAWGSLNADETSIKYANLSNTGDVNIDTTIQETASASDLSHTTGSAGQDEYLLEFSLDEGAPSWADLASGAPATLETNVPASGQANNYTKFMGNITMGSSFSEEWDEQTITIQIAYTEHT